MSARPRHTRTAALIAGAALTLSTGFLSVDPLGPAELLLGAESVSSDTIDHVANLTYDGRYGADDNRGSDLEFATIPVDVEREVTPGNAPDGRRGNGPKPRTVTTTEERTFSFAGSYTNGLQIIDVSDPGSPQPTAVYDCAIAQGDVQVFERDARRYVAYTRDTGYSNDTDTSSACFQEAEALGFGPAEELGPGTFIADVTDPTAPTTVSFVSFPKGSHNQTVHPSGDYLYNSNSELFTSVAGDGVGIEIVDITDLSEPVEAGFVELPIRPGLGTESHDISFNDDGTRAYSAALSQTVILDTSDPVEPEIISSIVDPTINVEHQAEMVTLTDPLLGERDFLIIEDEVAGASPTGQCPNGGVHIYDITGEREQMPVKVGYWNISDLGPTADGLGTCTAHVFELHPDEQIMVIAYYNGGVRVVDLSGLVGVALGDAGIGMQEVASFRFADSDTWAVKAPSVDRDGVFHIYGNDQRRGFDAYRVDLSDPATVDASRSGEWLTPEEITARAAAAPPVDLEANPFGCLVRGR